jgi:adenylate cyclase
VASEIERKFLVSEPPDGLDAYDSSRIEQGYVAVDQDAEVRVRRRDGETTLTVKSAPGRTRVEEEWAIDADRFAALWELTGDRRIVKTRHLIPAGELTVELDVYEGDLAGLCTAEVEFGSEAESDAWQAPGWLGREVTGDPHYANQSLALRGAPQPAGKPRLPRFVSELPVTRRALEFAMSRHQGQRRDADAAPFILHPLEVAHMLRGRDYSDEVVAAGVLHDIVEDTDVSAEELEQRFGPLVASLVAAVSEPSAEGTYPERKARLRHQVSEADGAAVAIYAADKVAKARELRLRVARDPRHRIDPQKLDHYRASLDMLDRRLGAHPLVGELRFELETLATLPPDA